jgi:hypothetical protein
MKGRVWFVVAVVTYLGVMGCVIWPSDAPAGKTSVDFNQGADVHPVTKLEGLPYRGIAMQVQRIENLMDYGRCVDKIAEIGADTILFVVDSKQESGSSSHIFLDMRGEPTPEKLGELIQYAHNKNLRVILMPLVLLEAPRGNEWRGVIHPEVWEDWWDSYREMLHHYSTVAEKNHVEVFVVGSELVSTERADQLEEWTRTIRQVRHDFHGPITYSANWDHYTGVQFWDQLDLMGLNSYYTLGDTNQAGLAEIKRRWQKIQGPLLGFQRKINKPLVMLEVGWCSMGNAVTEPWDYTKLTEPLDLDIQKRLYEGYFESWWGTKGFGGFMVWAWTPNASGPQDRGYTPEGKPAEEVLRKWLAKGPWQVQ